MNSPGHQFLSSAGRTDDQGGSIAPGSNPPDDFKQLKHGFAAPDDIGKVIAVMDFGPKLSHFPAQTAPLQGFLNRNGKLIKLKRFADIILGPKLHGFYR